jgi:hypothetical protein
MITFDDIRSPGFSAECQHCGEVTLFTGKQRYILADSEFPTIIPEYQCQDSGELCFSLPDDKSNDAYLLKRCECGGQFRRDKPLFCAKCLKNKTSENISM